MSKWDEVRAKQYITAFAEYQHAYNKMFDTQFDVSGVDISDAFRRTTGLTGDQETNILVLHARLQGLAMSFTDLMELLDTYEEVKTDNE